METFGKQFRFHQLACRLEKVICRPVIGQQRFKFGIVPRLALFRCLAAQGGKPVGNVRVLPPAKIERHDATADALLAVKIPPAFSSFPAHKLCYTNARAPLYLSDS